LRSAWPSKYPGETIQKLEPAGAPSSFEKEESTGKQKIDEHGDRYEHFVKVTYCRVPAKATILRAGGSQVVFEVSAIYKQTAGGFVFSDIGVSGSSEVAGTGQEPPSKEDAKKLIADYWVQKNPGTRVEKVAISTPELKKDASAGRWWYTTGADIYVIQQDGTKQKCSNDYTTIYKGTQGKEGVDASGPYKVYFLDDPSCQ
jgi:hypothetical protein